MQITPTGTPAAQVADTSSLTEDTRAGNRRGEEASSRPEMWVFNTERHPGLDTVESTILQERIVDHAYTRIQLFYYLCLAYWDEGVNVTRSATCMQHGIGPYNGAQAAHSSILPATEDDFWASVEGRLKKEGWTDAMERQLLALGLNDAGCAGLKADVQKRRGKGRIQFAKYFDGIDGHSLVSRDTAFFQAMNSTIVLPAFVNYYDCRIERVMRDRAVDLLNDCSYGRMTPYEATARFVDEIQDFFQLSLEETEEKLELLDQLYVQEQAMAAHEPKLRHLAAEDDAGRYAWFVDYVNLARDIVSTRDSINALKKSESVASALKKRHQRLDAAMNEVRPYLRCTESVLAGHLKGMRGRQKKVLDARLAALAKEIDKSIFYPYPLGWVRENVLASMDMIEAQAEGSSLPERALLSGVMEDGELRPMTKAELFDQKLQIIQRVELVEYSDNDFPAESVYPPRNPA
jgi:hypothetical protein